MKINSEIKQEFIGEINGVVMNHERTFWTTDFLLRQIAGKFEELELKKEFIEDLFYSIREKWNSSDFSMREIETELEKDIINADSFVEISFNLFGEEYGFEEINKKIKNGEYLI